MVTTFTSPVPTSTDESRVALSPNSLAVEIVPCRFPDISLYKIPAGAGYDDTANPLTVLGGDCRLFFVENGQVTDVLVVGPAIADPGVVVLAGARTLLTTTAAGNVLPISAVVESESTIWKGTLGPATADGTIADLLSIDITTTEANVIILIMATFAAGITLNASGSGRVRFTITVDGVEQTSSDITPSFVGAGEVGTELSQSGAVEWMVTLAAPGLHTIALRWNVVLTGHGHIDNVGTGGQFASLRVTTKPNSTISVV